MVGGNPDHILSCGCPECQGLPVAPPRNGASIVDERAKIRGPFDDQARVSQNLKMTVRAAPTKFGTMSPVTKEAVDQIMEKLARALTGDQWEEETWVDIQGYAELVLRSKEKVS